MIVSISRADLDKIVAEAEKNADFEVCGLLLGWDGMILDVVPAANVAADPACRFEIDPATLIAAHRATRSGGLPILGNYHSHPTGVAIPSAEDAANACAGDLWLIVGGGEAALFRADSAGPVAGRFHPVQLRVSDGLSA